METLEIQQNNPFAVDLIFYDDSVDPSVLMDITGLTVFVSVKKLTDFKQDDTEAVISSKITVHTDPTNGETQWELLQAETLIPLGSYIADVRLYTNALHFVNSQQFIVDIVKIITKREV